MINYYRTLIRLVKTDGLRDYTLNLGILCATEGGDKSTGAGVGSVKSFGGCLHPFGTTPLSPVTQYNSKHSDIGSKATK